MEYILRDTNFSLIALGFSCFSLLYSAYQLFFQVRRKEYLTGSVATSPVDPDHFLLELIAVTEPRVKRLLVPSPDELYVTVHHVGGPPETSPQGVITARRGEEEDSVKIDLGRRKDLEPLFNVLLNRIEQPSPTPSSKHFETSLMESNDVG
jgi:hypothetical protein